MKYEEKQKSIALRKNGKSIKEIAKELGVAKASVSVWVRNVSISKDGKERLVNRSLSRDIIERRRDTRIKNEEGKRGVITELAGRDISDISLHELKIIGATLYWAEGGKTNRGLVRIANADPKVQKIMMRFFREVCGVKEEKFRGHIHTHSHLNVTNSLNYWSQVTGVPISQFYKTYSKPSLASKGKKDTVPFGTLDIVICDTKLFLTIMGWIRKISELVLK